MMKKTHWILGMALAMTLNSCAQPDTKAYLKKVIEKLEDIKSVEYHEKSTTWSPYEDEPLFGRTITVHEYVNPTDTAFGSCFVNFVPEENMRFDGGYDGNVKMTIYADKKEVMIDDFSTNRLPFRTVRSFFNNVKSILKYAIETTDSIETNLMDEDSCWHYSLTVHEKKQVEFFGKAFYMPNQQLLQTGEDPTSHYEVWIRKSDNLPYKFYRKMCHDINLTECIHPIFNKLSLTDFNLYDYIPKDYKVRYKTNMKTGQQAKKVYALQDKTAPQWTLTDIEDRPISLADIKSKIVLLNFTGIGCGACQLAIPFLKELKAKYAPEDFELIAIESWSGRTSSRKGYAVRKELNYSILGATEKALQDYQTGRAAPWFFLLDEKRIIRKIFFGYNESQTKKEIEEAITSLLKEP